MNSTHIPLYFKKEISLNEKDKHVRDGLSAAIRTGDYLWVCCDERTTLERLQLQSDGSFGNHQSYDLTDLIHLPGGRESEIDIEGLAYDQHYLWLVGSHSLARKKPRKEDSPDKQIKRLTKLKQDPNRYLLARVPLVQDPETGEYRLFKTCPHPDFPDQTLSAAQLAGNDQGNELMDALASDEHFKDFLKIPGKDNGFDIEGLAVQDGRIFLGIRGPVLRGWAAVLEVTVREKEAGILSLEKQPEKTIYRKHFLHLEGMGVRDLLIIQQDLYLLAGPTMDLDGTIAVYRWPEALTAQQPAIVHRKELQRLFDVPHGQGKTSGQDKAEGLAHFAENQLLVVFDSPTDARKPGVDSVLADCYSLVP